MKGDKIDRHYVSSTCFWIKLKRGFDTNFVVVVIYTL